LYHKGASFLKSLTEMKVGELPIRGTFLICNPGASAGPCMSLTASTGLEQTPTTLGSVQCSPHHLTHSQ
jgi:hypothetical protein